MISAHSLKIVWTTQATLAKHQDQITPTGKTPTVSTIHLPKTGHYPNPKTTSFHPSKKRPAYVIHQTMTTILTVTLIQTKLKNPECSHQTRVTRPSCSNVPMTKKGRSAESLCYHMLSTSLGVVGGLASVSLPKAAQAEEFKRGTRSFLWDHFLSPVCHPRMRWLGSGTRRRGSTGYGTCWTPWLGPWRYVFFYIRLKTSLFEAGYAGCFGCGPRPSKEGLCQCR